VTGRCKRKTLASRGLQKRSIAQAQIPAEHHAKQRSWAASRGALWRAAPRARKPIPQVFSRWQTAF